MIYKHKKTGTLYRHGAFGRDCTNGERDGTRVVIYRPLNSAGGATYVCDYAEHMEKFEIVADDPGPRYRLLTAAPDLLAVCEELVESAYYWSDYDVPIGIVDRLNAAIAKAGGTALRTPDRCQWVKDGDLWNTACGDFHNPSDNNMVFCPYCGRPINAENASEAGN